MLPSESPFETGWWGIALDKAGLVEDRPDVGTYGLYEFERLPPLSLQLQGDFTWLDDIPELSSPSIYAKPKENSEAIKILAAQAVAARFALPTSIVTFCNSPSLPKRIRSFTGCYLDLSPGLIPFPTGNGFLIRFLADQQDSLFWYVYITSDGTDHAVVSTQDFYGTQAEGCKPNPAVDPEAIIYNAESFEVFMCRYWLENEIAFAYHENSPLSAVCKKYIERYQSGISA